MVNLKDRISGAFWLMPRSLANGIVLFRNPDTPHLYHSCSKSHLYEAMLNWGFGYQWTFQRYVANYEQAHVGSFFHRNGELISQQRT